MSKYISEDILLEDLWDSKCESDILRRVRQAIVDEIIGIEGIDIVRCKECKRCYKDTDALTSQTVLICQRYNDEDRWARVNSDDFCSYGEREGE